ncbi:hypothetical protein Htur_3437 [Haloterrigena turkmenica DSM 5511]|uniref:Uncharacterized protein n=1 Tax=Haloterrigena turkmenica (strain ATCC 51198 / DSM 5511 / JCM 9101 / NCIMB 13204 / VKM B-1734 / 4k) TaxID=543526 RepID=D2RQC3_HALTV|nr:hypothetical protein [Haloterrigena turkmenica]ADB62300.1 hypothetical protein Htur_3437 [Haloterrigena turkmenica DSM 5511]
MEWTRRRVVGTTATVAAVAGCLGEDGSGSDNPNSSDDADASADSDDGSDETGGSNETAERSASAALEDAALEDYTGQEEVTITVDPEGEGFEPAAFEIDPETLLVWQWKGSSTEPYPIDIPEGCIWDQEVDEETVEDRSSGDEFDRLFTVPGAYRYGSRDADGEEFTGGFRVVGSGETDDE